MNPENFWLAVAEESGESENPRSRPGSSWSHRLMGAANRRPGA